MVVVVGLGCVCLMGCTRGAEDHAGETCTCALISIPQH